VYVKAEMVDVLGSSLRTMLTLLSIAFFGCSTILAKGWNLSIVGAASYVIPRGGVLKERVALQRTFAVEVPQGCPTFAWRAQVGCLSGKQKVHDLASVHGASSPFMTVRML